LLRNTFKGDKNRMKYFTDQVRLINGQFDALVVPIFPSDRIEQHSINTRLNETENENLHVDVCKDARQNHHLRLFVNLAVVQRIWHTCHSLEHVLKTSLNLLDEDFLRKSTPGRICHDLNFAVFKGFAERGREGQPKHIVFFEPSEVWGVNSRKVSHQIFFGRKAVSTEHAIANDSMTNQSSHYYESVNRYRNKLPRPIQAQYPFGRAPPELRAAGGI